MSRFAEKVTELSTLLLMLAVIAFFIANLFGYYIDADGKAHAFILGDAALGDENLIHLEDAGNIFAFLDASLSAIVILFAGLSFAAIIFDEEKNIWFRVVSVAALMLIIFGGLNIF